MTPDEIIEANRDRCDVIEAVVLIRLKGETGYRLTLLDGMHACDIALSEDDIRSIETAKEVLYNSRPDVVAAHDAKIAEIRRRGVQRHA